MNTIDTRCVAVFTARSPQRIFQEGVGASLGARCHARADVTVPRLRSKPKQSGSGFLDASEPHGSAYLVGRISDVIPSSEDPTSGRWMIQIREYSTVQNPKNVWQGWRNPIKYGTLEDFGIDVGKLVFHSVAEIQDPPPRQPVTSTANDGGTVPISITAAKRGLAAFYGIPPDAIEIVIRG